MDPAVDLDPHDAPATRPELSVEITPAAHGVEPRLTPRLRKVVAPAKPQEGHLAQRLSAALEVVEEHGEGAPMAHLPGVVELLADLHRAEQPGLNRTNRHPPSGANVARPRSGVYGGACQRRDRQPVLPSHVLRSGEAPGLVHLHAE